MFTKEQNRFRFILGLSVRNPLSKMKRLVVVIAMIFLPISSAFAQTGTIEGTVVEAATGSPIPGANILVEGTEVGTATDSQGQYSLEVEAGTYSVRASFVGYASQSVDDVEVEGGGSTTVDFQLKASAVGLEDVVVVGYGEQERRDLTGSVGSVSAQDIDRTNATRVEETLQGRVAGVSVTNVNRSAPGSGLKVRIRGNSSINAGNGPLYVLDGVPVTGGLGTISTNDIESIEVLKDASATAIYGARGANGVVLITTKGGTRGESTVEFDAYYGQQRARKQFDVLNGEDYARYINDAFTLNGREAPFENPEQFGEGTDWQDVVLRPAPTQNYHLALRGGSENTTYSISGAYKDQEGVVRGSSFNRGSFRANLRGDLTDRLSLGTNLTLSRSIRKGVMGIGSAATYVPIVPVRNDDGEYAINTDLPSLSFLNPSSNPLANIIEPTRRDETTRGLGNGYVELEVIDNLQLRASLGMDYRENKGENYTPLNSGLTNVVNTAGISTGQQFSWLLEGTMNYNNVFAELHSIDAVLGYTMEEVTAESVNVSAREFLTDYFLFNNLGVASDPLPPGSGYGSYALQSYLGRVNYTLSDKYLFTLTGRVDGSSRFGAGNKYGFFPSGAVAWRASEEPFIQDLGVFSNLKLRTSYGVTGNQQIGNYLALSNFGPSNYSFGNELVKGIGPRGVANPDLKWERTSQLDIGLDAGFFDNRLSITADYYYKKTSDLLLAVNLPFTSGFASATENVGSVMNEGLELALGYNNSWGEFEWNANANFSTNRNEVLDLGPDTDQIIIDAIPQIAARARGGASIIKEGYPLGSFYTYVYEGIWQSQEQINEVGTMPNAQPGEARFKDVNGDGTFNTLDLKVIPTGYPDFTYGISNTFSYAGFDLSVFIQGQSGNEILNGTATNLRNPNAIGNLSEEAADYWTPDNKDAAYPRPQINYTGRVSTRDLEDGSYLRVKNMTLGYDLSENIVDSVSGVREARVYVQGQNLLTLTDYSGLDPEVNIYGGQTGRVGYDQSSQYPAAQTYTVGLNLTF